VRGAGDLLERPFASRLTMEEEVDEGQEGPKKT
jgi:hypothetical protein